MLDVLTQKIFTIASAIGMIIVAVFAAYTKVKANIEKIKSEAKIKVAKNSTARDIIAGYVVSAEKKFQLGDNVGKITYVINKMQEIHADLGLTAIEIRKEVDSILMVANTFKEFGGTVSGDIEKEGL